MDRATSNEANQHIAEETLELFVLNSDALVERRESIASHLQECAGCAALHEEIVNYYADVERARDQQVSARPRALALRSFLVKIPPPEHQQSLREMPKTLPARFFLFVIRHPIMSSSGAFGMMAGLALLMFLAVPNDLFKDTNPSYARAKDEFLVTYNKEGEVLWRKKVGIGYDGDKLLALGRGLQSDEYLATVDVDSDGRNEVVAIFGAREEWPNRNAVFCYNANSSLRWRYDVSRKTRFGSESFADSWDAATITVYDLKEENKKSIIAKFNHGASYYPQLLIHLDGGTGDLTGEYWHSGSLLGMTRVDIDHDGVEDLIYVGENNGYDMASLVVLDSRQFSGHAPAPPAYTPQGVPQGNEEYYLLFPRNDLKAVATHKRNRARVVRTPQSGMIDVLVHEEVRGEEPTVLYHFNFAMECLSVDGSDGFVPLHRKLEAEGKLTKKLDDAYWEDLRRSVLYWDGEKFMKTPTMNKKYLEAVGQLAKK